MKFIFKNLGPIHEAELELGDLTIIAGRNNTGKTYVAYTLYGFLKMWQVRPNIPMEFDLLMRDYRHPDVASRFPDMEKSAQMLSQEGRVKWAADREEMGLVQESVVQEMALKFSEESLPRVFSSSDQNFADASLGVMIEGDFPEYVPPRILSIPGGDTFVISYSRNEICIQRDSTTGSPLPREVIRDLLPNLYLFSLLPEFPSELFIISAERFGISLFYKELDFAQKHLGGMLSEMARDSETTRSRLSPLINTYERTKRYSIPIKDNINYTRNISNLPKLQNEIYDAKLFNDIKNMLDGDYRRTAGDIRFKSKARKAQRFDLPLHLASSSVRGLSDLYFFLRHVAEKEQILIIDEPESHLDTANQIQFARLLARAVHAGLKVLITTHSDYIVKEVNNLLMLGQEFKEKPRVLKKHGYSKHDFLKPESVRAYVAEKNSLTRCTVDRFGIDMPVFDKTIDAINRVSSELEARLTHEGEE